MRKVSGKRVSSSQHSVKNVESVKTVNIYQNAVNQTDMFGWKLVPRRGDIIECEDCGKKLPKEKIYRWSWRYNSKTSKYKGSKRAFILTGFKYLCKACLKKRIT